MIHAILLLVKRYFMETLVILGQRLRALRLEAGKKQKDMAELMDCTVSNYQKIEYGHVNIPTTDLVLLADHYGVSTDYLVGRTDDPTPPSSKEETETL